MTEKLEENKTESILSRIANRAMKGMRRGANIPENQGILQTLAQRASSPTGQFYATLADPNAYYDKQGFGSAGTGMRSAQQAHQGAETARAAMQAKGIATPTSQLASATSLHNKLQGDYGVGKPVPHPITGEIVDYNALDGTLQSFYVKEFQARLMGLNDGQVRAMLKKQFAKLTKMKEIQEKTRNEMKKRDPEEYKKWVQKNKDSVAFWTEYNKKYGYKPTAGEPGNVDFAFNALLEFGRIMRNTDFPGVVGAFAQTGGEMYKDAKSAAAGANTWVKEKFGKGPGEEWFGSGGTKKQGSQRGGLFDPTWRQGG